MNVSGNSDRMTSRTRSVIAPIDSTGARLWCIGNAGNVNGARGVPVGDSDFPFRFSTPALAVVNDSMTGDTRIDPPSPPASRLPNSHRRLSHSGAIMSASGCFTTPPRPRWSGPRQASRQALSLARLRRPPRTPLLPARPGLSVPPAHVPAGRKGRVACPCREAFGLPPPETGRRAHSIRTSRRHPPDEPGA